jgi:hypothetical protein
LFSANFNYGTCHAVHPYILEVRFNTSLFPKNYLMDKVSNG